MSYLQKFLKHIHSKIQRLLSSEVKNHTKQILSGMFIVSLVCLDLLYVNLPFCFVFVLFCFCFSKEKKRKKILVSERNLNGIMMAAPFISFGSLVLSGMFNLDVFSISSCFYSKNMSRLILKNQACHGSKTSKSEK